MTGCRALTPCDGRPCIAVTPCAEATLTEAERSWGIKVHGVLVFPEADVERILAAREKLVWKQARDAVVAERYRDPSTYDVWSRVLRILDKEE